MEDKTMTLGDMIPDVRKLVNDTVVEYRWPDGDIAGYLRDAIIRLRVVRQAARFDDNGRIITEGDQVVLGGNDRYTAMCHKCWKQRIKEQEEA